MQAANKRGQWARTKIQARPIWTASLAATISFLLGMGAGSGGTESQLSLLQSKLSSVQTESASAVGAAQEAAELLETENADLAAENAELDAERAELAEEFQKLNARREIPDLVGASRSMASSLEDKYGWDLVETARFSTRPAGTILSQTPAAGTMMRYGGVYRVVVAKAPPSVPSLKGLTVGKARSALAQYNWNVVVSERISSRRPGTVLTVSPGGGARLMPGSTVTLTVAVKAPPPPPAPEPLSGTPSGSGCTPGYSPCLPPASDYDCAGGSGDGPKYTGYVTVTGSDPYGLDTDGDGAGCETS